MPTLTHHDRRSRLLLPLMLAITLTIILAGLLLTAAPAALAQTGTTWGGELTENTIFTLAQSPHIVTQELVVPQGITLTIEPGAEVQFLADVSFIVRGRLLAQGTLTQTIRLTWRDEGMRWGRIVIASSTADNLIAHAEIAHHQGIYVQFSPLRLLYSEIYDVAGDAVVSHDGQVLIQGNHVHDVNCDYPCEGIQIRETQPEFPALVLDNHVHHINDDCLDINEATVIARRNHLHHCDDKGISVGPPHEHSGLADWTNLGPLLAAYPTSATLVNNLIYSASIGIAVKDGAFAHILHTTIVSATEGLVLDESWDHPGYGGGQARVANTILWGNGTPIRLDLAASPPASLTLLHSDVEGGWEGAGNLDVNPGFVSANDFHLRVDSPLVDAGRDEGVATDIEGQHRPVWSGPDIGAYEVQSPLRLSAQPGDGHILLSWEVLRDAPTLSSFTISATASSPGGTAYQPPLVTDLPTTTRAYTLTSLTNYVRYTAWIEGRDALGRSLGRSNLAHAMPNAGFTVHLPILLRQEAPQPPEPPLYYLTIAPDDLAWLYDLANLWTYETVPAVFTDGETSYDVQVRFRGGTTRYQPKKSWKIQFPAAAPYQGQRELNLNAEYPDKSLLREKLAYDLFDQVGLPASRTEFVRLEINGQYMGVYLQVEQVDQRFLQRVGWNPNGNLYKGDYGGNFDWIGEDVADAYAKKTNRDDGHADVVALLRAINLTSDAEFPAALTARMDVGQYLDWYTLQILLGNYEWLEKNYYLFHDLDPNENWWALTPWDLDLTLGHNWGADGILDQDITWDNPIDSGTVSSPKADGKWNKLITRVLAHEPFRFAYCRRLQEMMHGPFTEEALFPPIDQLYQYITPYAEADPYKWGDNDEFHAGPAELRTYITQRRAWLTARIPDYCPTSGPMVLLNELMPHNAAALPDEAGEYEPWIELFNPGLVHFDVGGMALQLTTTTALTPTHWTIPTGTVIPPGGFLLVWADGEPDEGALHADFRLDSPVPSGTVTVALSLLDKPVFDNAPIDRRDYRPAAVMTDTTLGRAADGATPWVTFTAPYVTPGWSNLGRAPTITGTARAPLEPDAGQPVTVTAFVSARQPTPTVSLRWTAAGVAHISEMEDDGAHGDTIPEGGWYTAIIPPLDAGTVVTYYVQAENTAGLAHDPAIPCRYVVGFHPPALQLNELLAINESGREDEAGERDDWFEIYNAGPITVDLGGLYLTDRLEHPTLWQIPAGVTAPPGGYTLFWADAEPEQGPTHVGFELDGDGERLALYAGPAGYHELIDQVYYGPQTANQPLGRYPDGAYSWRPVQPTPGQANRQHPPVVSELSVAPPAPQPGEPIVATAHIHDDGQVLSATLYYTIHHPLSPTHGGGFHTAPLTPTGGDLYSAPIPSATVDAIIHYYVQAWDDEGSATIYPTTAPTTPYGCRIGHAPPPLLLNEFLASNAAVNPDEWGEYEDWVELYNAGSADLDIGGMYLTDDLGDPAKWRIPAGTLIPAGGFLLIWTDDDGSDGPLHTGFKLRQIGEEIGLFDRDEAGRGLIDHVIFGSQATDLSTGRSPDGGEAWRVLTIPTPGETNAPPLP